MDEEFMNTLRNIGTSWYQCPNGHAYVIGECGLAMVESICPECGERIGGKDHKLLDTNKLVDFDKDIKNNINISPVKIIKNENKENNENDNDNKKDIINEEKKDEVKKDKKINNNGNKIENKDDINNNNETKTKDLPKEDIKNEKND